MRNSGKLPCPVCGAETVVYDTELENEGVHRRRRCINGHRFNTYESRIGQVWDHDRRVVPIVKDDYDGGALAARLNTELEGVDEM